MRDSGGYRKMTKTRPFCHFRQWPSRGKIMEWFRWYHGAISDPKWPLIARKSGQNIGTVVSVWAAMLEFASQSEDRGSVEGFDCEQIDALFGYPDGTTESVCNAMKRHVTDETGFIVSWEKRQVKREREGSSTERVRAHRAKKKEQEIQKDTTEKRDETPCNASVTPGNTQNRTDKNRGEKKKDTYAATHPEYAAFAIQFQTKAKDLHGNIAPAISDSLINNATETVDKLIRIDGFTFEQVCDAMNWAVLDDFWSKNALSLAGLRAKNGDGRTKFQKIMASMDGRKNKQTFDNMAGVI